MLPFAACQPRLVRNEMGTCDNCILQLRMYRPPVPVFAPPPLYPPRPPIEQRPPGWQTVDDYRRRLAEEESLRDAVRRQDEQMRKQEVIRKKREQDKQLQARIRAIRDDEDKSLAMMARIAREDTANARAREREDAEKKRFDREFRRYLTPEVADHRWRERLAQLRREEQAPRRAADGNDLVQLSALHGHVENFTPQEIALNYGTTAFQRYQSR